MTLDSSSKQPEHGRIRRKVAARSEGGSSTTTVVAKPKMAQEIDESDKHGSQPTASATASADVAGSEIGGPEGAEPTRFGDWEHKGRCIDF